MKKKFRYTCKGCGRSFQLELDVAELSLHTAACPFCARSALFDNRSGILARLGGGGASGGSSSSSYGSGSSSSGSYSSGATASQGSGYSAPTPRPASTGTDTGRYNIPVRSGSTKDYSSQGWKARSGREDRTGKDRRRDRKSRFSLPALRLPHFELPGRGGRQRLLVLGGMALAALALVYGIIITVQVILFDPDPYIQSIGSRSPNRIYDRDGKLISELFSLKTGTLKFEEIPKEMADVLLFVEDEGFYSHGAIDLFSTARAMFANLTSMGFVQGASTITQQLARILLDERQKTLARKAKEASLAFALEARYSKKEILTGYFNNVYLGHGAYGFETAADFYFGHTLQQLSFTERLALACLPSAPEKFSPLRNPELLIRKMDHVYGRMQEHHFPTPGRDEYESQKASVLSRLNRSPSETVFGTRSDNGPYVTEYIRGKIREILGADVETSAGLRIETTIDVGLQRSAVKNSREFLDEIRKLHPYRHEKGDDKAADISREKEQMRKEYLQRALGAALLGMPIPRTGNKRLETASIGLDPKTGEILFMQGGSQFFPENQLNRSIQMRRQTGSAIKPIVYSAGIESGVLSPATPLEDSPLFFSGVHTQGKDFWLPDNIDEDYEGVIPLRVALAKSRNIPAIRAAGIIGLDRVGEQFRKFFFHSNDSFNKRFRAEQGVAIGILEMSPLEMALAFSAFGNNGVMKRPYLIRRIVNPAGTVLFDGTQKDEFRLNMPEEITAVGGDTAEVMSSLLRDSAHFGGAGRGGFSSPLLMGKTGTTNKHRDAWFVGVLPHLAAAVWVGFDNPEVSMTKGTGAGVAGPLFGRIVSGSGRSYEADGYVFNPHAKDATVCADTGLIPNKFCPRRKTEIFSVAGLPRKTCEKHSADATDHPSLPDLPTKSDFN